MRSNNADREQRTQELCLKFNMIEDSIIKEAYLTDSKEALELLKIKAESEKRIKRVKKNMGYRTVAACLGICLLVAVCLFGVIRFSGNRFGSGTVTTSKHNSTVPNVTEDNAYGNLPETVRPDNEDIRDVYAFEVGRLDSDSIVEYSRSRMVNSGKLSIQIAPHLGVIEVDSDEDASALMNIIAGQNKGHERIFSHMDEEYFKDQTFYFIYIPTSNTGGEYIIDSIGNVDNEIVFNIKCVEEGDAEALSGWLFCAAFSKGFLEKYDSVDAIYVLPLEEQYPDLNLRDVCAAEIGRMDLFSENDVLKESIVNKDKLGITTEAHQAVYKIDSVSDLDIVLGELVKKGKGDLPCKGYKPMQDVLGEMDDGYFSEYTLYMIYLPTTVSNGAYDLDFIATPVTGEGAGLCIYVKDETLAGDFMLSGWLFTVSVPNDINNILTSVDAILNRRTTDEIPTPPVGYPYRDRRVWDAYHPDDSERNPYFSVTVPELGDALIEHREDDRMIYVNGEKLHAKTLAIFTSVYLADITGDGKPEVCVVNDFASGVCVCHIEIYDAETLECISRLSNSIHDYYLFARNGNLCVKEAKCVTGETVRTGMLVYNGSEITVSWDSEINTSFDRDPVPGPGDTVH